MTIQTEFYNYQTNLDKLDWDKPPYESCNPAPVGLKNFLETLEWINLGCHGDRPIREGATPSTHSFGGAIDMRYPTLELADVMVAFLIGVSEQIGLQAIHHYNRCIIWRPPGTSGRGEDGWKVQTANPRNGMGQSWAMWLHCEFLPSKLSLKTLPILKREWKKFEEAFNPNLPVGPTEPAELPELVPGTRNIVNVEVPTVRRGSVDQFGGNAVKTVQRFCNDFLQPTTPIMEDGQFGPATSDLVKNYQAWKQMSHVDSIVGPKTWALIFEDMVS